MSRALAMEVAMRRALHSSLVAQYATDLAGEHAGAFERIELARDFARDPHAALASALGAEGIVVTPAEVYADLGATTNEAMSLHNDWIAAAGRVPAATYSAWNAWLIGFGELRRIILERFAAFEQSERVAAAGVPEWLRPYISGGWDPVGRARFLADVQSLNTRLEEQKQQLRAWRQRFVEVSGSQPSAPGRVEQTPPSGQLAPLLPSLADTASSLSTVVVVGVVGAIVLAFLALRGAS